MKVPGVDAVDLRTKMASQTLTPEASLPSGTLIGNNAAGSPADSFTQEMHRKSKEQQVRQAMEQINTALEAFQSKVRYQLEYKNNTYVIQLVEKEGDRVLYQMPPDGILQVAEKLKEALGMIIDLKV
ncbi:flagellar protein FlaG [Effusibacillus dendaii]|uniref:Flagellar biosynthesis protein FlaG n=1 Tax=Effusibacillus dendaii TaxID=2743772 RepID=A0A7I8DH03_9BACL|nr:flagellar protein FlaG [Effusibacillus dendaii]BCJ87870.1 hypothetical protein skT53_28550 [Effusibacillus dendaii]